jgi:hypothetical protein
MMSRCLRMSHYASPHSPPVTMVISEEDITLPSLEAVIEDTMKAGFFFAYEIIEGSDVVTATLNAPSRIRVEAHREQNMAVAYFYYLRALQFATEVVASTETAPLSRKDMAWVFRCLAHHPTYKGQRVIVPLEDGTTIEMTKGEVLPVG